MSEVVIAGIGQVPVGEHWDASLRNLASRAILAAIKDAGGMRPQALYIGNFLGSVISHQSNLGALLVDNSGLDGIESFTVEAGAASARVRCDWVSWQLLRDGLIRRWWSA
jgi:acetyl-CoA C-acetyltransferase